MQQSSPTALFGEYRNEPSHLRNEDSTLRVLSCTTGTIHSPLRLLAYCDRDRDNTQRFISSSSPITLLQNAVTDDGAGHAVQPRRLETAFVTAVLIIASKIYQLYQLYE